MVIRTIIFYILLYIWTIFLGVLFIPFLLLPNRYIRIPAIIWIKSIFAMLKYVCQITHEIRGLENLPNEGAIVVSKHQSAFETFALFYYIKKSFFIHKKQLFYIPIFGQYLMKSNMVAIDREGKTKTMRKMLIEVKKRIKDGSSIIIFPEGTRKQPGDKPDYKTGYLGIYNEVKRKLVPIALNSGLFWPKNSFVMNRGKIIIEIKPHIESNLNKDEVKKKVKETIENATNKLIT